MSQKETIYNLKQILEELKASEGLPENLSTEAQLWDEILKKETFLMPEQLFPLIKEIYGKYFLRIVYSHCFRPLIPYHLYSDFCIPGAYTYKNA